MPLYTLSITENSAEPACIPLYGHYIKAGFPSPADDFLDRCLSLDELLIQHVSATYFCRVSGESMIDAGIFDGDILIVDRALKPAHGDIVIATVNGAFTCKRLDLNKRRLIAENEAFPPIPITADIELMIEGVVTSSIRRHRC